MEISFLSERTKEGEKEWKCDFWEKEERKERKNGNVFFGKKTKGNEMMV
jgi:endonuclease YncB( thermonuclease family)